MKEPADKPARSPLEMLAALAKSDAELGDDMRLVEIYTLEGLLRILWFGQPGASDVVLMGGGAMGGLTGPGRSLYTALGRQLATTERAAMIVDYRKPGDLAHSVLDMCAAADLAMRNGAERFVVLGHSFGGAVAVQAAGTFPTQTAGVITFATQSGGCEEAHRMGDTPLLLVHGDRDSILGPENSMMVQTLAGHGQVKIMPGADHLLIEVADELFELATAWIESRFAEAVAE